MKMFFMMAYTRAKANRPVFAEVISILSGQGVAVTVGIGESIAFNPGALHVEADLYILKSNSALWRNVAAVLDAQGARILNSYSACVATINKIRAASRLSTAQVPIPRSWVTGDLALLADVHDMMPLVLKPNVGHGGAGIRLIRDRTELATTQIDDGMLVQELIAPVEDELKLYVIGESVYGVRKHRGTGEREPVAVEPLLGDLARQCGRALGLEVYGVDVLVSARGPFVIDVNYFPSFRGVPDVARPLAEYIRACAER